MASLATLAAVQPVSVKGLGGSSLTGTKLSVRPCRRSLARTSIRFYFETGPAQWWRSTATKVSTSTWRIWATPPASGTCTAPTLLHPTILFRASSLRHLQLLSPREDCCSSF
uniref:Photosystem I reaction center subunit VI n=1 Tax=Nelumbo nucifera TaxID=4432 RepID=A0A822Y4G5_NELNU|nr:TPA_asm: hypothetical protein HUJ06_028361 [Nelumbo nucifera]